MDLEQENILNHLQEIGEYEFEKFVAELWEQYRWDTTVTSGSNDRGVDIIAEKKRPVEQKHLIQAKRWGSGNKVGRPEIQQYGSLYQGEDSIDAVVVVTTSSFSRQAEDEAGTLNVKLIDGSEIIEILSEFDSEDLIRDYLDVGDPEADRDVTDDKSEGPEADRDVTDDKPEDSEAIRDVIFNKLNQEVREYRDNISGTKYNTHDNFKISFRSENKEVITLSLYYSVIYHNSTSFSIDVEFQGDIPEQAIERIRSLGLVEQVWMEGPNKLGINSTRSSISPECRVLSELIYEYRSNFSKDTKLYFDEPVPEPDIGSTDGSGDPGDDTSNNNKSETNHSNRLNEFEIEKEFDNLR